MLNLEADGQQQQKTALGSAPSIQDWESEATVGTDLPKVGSLYWKKNTQCLYNL